MDELDEARITDEEIKLHRDEIVKLSGQIKGLNDLYNRAKAADNRDNMVRIKERIAILSNRRTEMILALERRQSLKEKQDILECITMTYRRMLIA